MSKAASAGLFPCEVLVVEGDIETGRGQLLATHGPGGASANYRDIFHSNLSSPQGNRGVDAETEYSIKILAQGARQKRQLSNELLAVAAGD
jgi:hypothetical protein